MTLCSVCRGFRHLPDPSSVLVPLKRLQPSGGAYREAEHYSVLQHIQNGSYGDVFCVRDKRSGFRCAAKRIPAAGFSGEEVSTWSALDSPGVVELFGAVREGPNIVLFMELKPACLAELLKDTSCLPEDLALHYLHQTLRALEHLHHRKVLHLDVKADNVLLSADCRRSFLCDFGLAQTLDGGGRSSEAFGGRGLAGTETHMAPEVARGDRLSAKADVWSSCCMLLHMLNGHRPWTRLFCPPLCLQIVNEPPPLWEVPPHCNNFTAKVFRAGLQKDPRRRATAGELRRKTTKALRAVGGLSLHSVGAACETLRRVRAHHEDASCPLTPVDPVPPSPSAAAPAMKWVSSWRTAAVDEDRDMNPETDDLTEDGDSEPKSLRDHLSIEDRSGGSDSEVDIYQGKEEWLQTERDYDGDWEGEEEKEDWDSWESTEYLRALRGLYPLLNKGPLWEEPSLGSEKELQQLRHDIALGTRMQVLSPEPRDDPPSCFSCSESSQLDASERESDRSSDDLSSGVFSSCNGQSDSCLEWTASANHTSSRHMEGVDIWIENLQGECLRIRERRRVKVGHVAVGISEQVRTRYLESGSGGLGVVGHTKKHRKKCLRGTRQNQLQNLLNPSNILQPARPWFLEGTRLDWVVLHSCEVHWGVGGACPRQVLGKAFTLETLDRKTVSLEQEVQQSGLWLRCVPAPDRCRRWTWRVQGGKLEQREAR